MIVLSICHNKEHYKYQYLQCSITFCLQHLTATWTEHCHCTGNINLSQRWEFWIGILKYQTHKIHRYINIYGSVSVQYRERRFLRIDHLWPSKPIRWHFLDADKVWLARNYVLCWDDCNISDLWCSGAQHEGFMWQRLR